MISVIVRAKNEERWIRPCIEGILRQDVPVPVEIILVDNRSTDKTVEKALAVSPHVRVLSIDEFLPGRALNRGIREAKGDYIACLSAHCVPVDEHWLRNLLRNLDDSRVAGVYGRQVPAPSSSPHDKRDLFITFGLDRRIQVKDSFFHNANSMLPRRVWDRFPFDEDISNIEDRLWGKNVIAAEHTIVYEPEAAVYHHHGIHQDNKPDRALSIAQILDRHLPDLQPQAHGGPFDPSSYTSVAFIPVQASENHALGHALLLKAIATCRNSRYVSDVVVATDSTDLARVAVSAGARVPFLRPRELSEPGIRVDDVLGCFLRKSEERGDFCDIVVSLEISYGFRPEGLIDSVIEELVKGGFDSVIAGVAEYRACWRKRGSGFEELTNMTVERNRREPLHVGVPGLACATWPNVVRGGARLGEKVGIVEIPDAHSGLEIRSARDLEMIRRGVEDFALHADPSRLPRRTAA